MDNLTDIEIGVLKLVNNYGVDLDLSAPRISRTIKAAGRELLRKGYLTGTMKAVSLTVRGAGVVAPPGERNVLQPSGGYYAPNQRPWPGPTPEMVNGNPLFDAIWSIIKTWDINVPHAYSGYMGATGNHARAIYDAVTGVVGGARD